MSNKNLKPIRVTDKTALRLIHEHAPKQHRSLANCAATAIIKALSEVTQNNDIDAADAKQGESEKVK